MKLTSKARYGLRLCYELGKKTKDSLSTSELSMLTGYSVKYIEQLMKPLKKADIVISERGATGGYRLSRIAEKITLGEIIRPLEDNLIFVKCVGNCNSECHCPSHGVWQKLYIGINNLLDSMTLQELIDDNNAFEGEEYEKKCVSRPCGNNRC